METKVTSEPKSNGVKNGGARIVVDNDDEVLRYGGKSLALALFNYLTCCRKHLNNRQMTSFHACPPPLLCSSSI